MRSLDVLGVGVLVLLIGVGCHFEPFLRGLVGFLGAVPLWLWGLVAVAVVIATSLEALREGDTRLDE